jgi:hypothetical protein
MMIDQAQPDRSPFGLPTYTDSLLTPLTGHGSAALRTPGPVSLFVDTGLPGPGGLRADARSFGAGGDEKRDRGKAPVPFSTRRGLLRASALKPTRPRQPQTGDAREADGITPVGAVSSDYREYVTTSSQHGDFAEKELIGEDRSPVGDQPFQKPESTNAYREPTLVMLQCMPYWPPLCV